MPIPNVALTKAEFENLQKSIVGVKNAVDTASGIAKDAVQYIADMQVAAPEVDLIVQFNSFLTLIEGLNVSSNYTAIVAALNGHGITRGGDSSGSLSARLLSYFDSVGDPSIKVSKAYQGLASAAGFEITDGYSNLDGEYLALIGGHDNNDTTGATTGYPDTVTSLSAGTWGQDDYDDDVTFFNGDNTPLKFSVIGLLPPGLAIVETGTNAGKIISSLASPIDAQGSFSTPTVFSFTVVVEDNLGNTDKANFSISVGV